MSSFSLSVNRLIYTGHEKDKETSILNNIISLIRCKICSSVLTDPYDCLCCNNTFCFTCINNSILKLNKCPFAILNSSQDHQDENFTNVFCKLKPSSSKITNFLSNLNFKCIFNNRGCNEEVSYNKIVLHEISCPFGKQPDSRNSNSLNSSNFIILAGMQNNNDSFYKKQINMSFNNKIEQNNSDNLFNLTENHNSSPANEKLEKILEVLQGIQFTMNNKTFATPTKECLANETPKFNMSTHNIKNDNYFLNNPFNTNTESPFCHNGYNLTLNLQQEKIISEIDLLHEKLFSIENQVENSILQNETLIKKIIEEQLNNCFEKFSNFPSTHFSSTTTSVNSFYGTNSTNYLRKTSADVDSNSVFKKMNSDKPKSKEFNSYVKPNKINSNYTSPKLAINKNVVKEKDLKIKKDSIKIKTTELNLNNNYNNNFKKENIDEANLISSSIVDKLEVIEKYLSEKIIPNFNIASTDHLFEDIKACIIEVTLDSTNLFVQKFDELTKQLKINYPLNSNEKI